MNAIIMPHPNYVEGIENGGFTMKTHQLFSVHTTPDESLETKVPLSKRIECFLFTLDTSAFEKLRFQMVFRRTKTKICPFQIPPV